MDLQQSSEFRYRGLRFTICPISHTQATFSVFTSSGEFLAGPFDAEAPGRPEAMVHVVRDGRENPWLKTDQEIRDAFDAFLACGTRFGHGPMIQKVKPFIQ